MPIDCDSLQKLIKFSISQKDFAVASPPLVFFRGINEVELKESDSYLAHVHEFFEVIEPLRGDYKCNLNNELVSVSQGSAVLMQYDDLHEDLFQKDTLISTLSFGIEDGPMRHLFSKQAGAQARILHLSAAPSLCCFLNEMRAESRSKHASLGLMEGLCQAFFWKLAEILPEELVSEDFKKFAEDDSFQRRILALFSKSLRGQFVLRDAAARLGVSERKLYSLCKELFGRSPANAFQSFKMQEAAKLLAKGDMKVADVAKAFGFSDPFHFSRAFKRHAGMSPVEFKSNAE